MANNKKGRKKGEQKKNVKFGRFYEYNLLPNIQYQNWNPAYKGRGDHILE